MTRQGIRGHWGVDAVHLVQVRASMITTDRPKKSLIYLDQNFVSEMAKLGLNSNVRPDFQRLFDLLHTGFLDEKCVVLRSAFHEVETSLSGFLREPIRARQSTLGHVRLEHPLHIRERQITRAMHRWLERPNVSEVLNFDDPFETWPDDRVPFLDIDVNTDWQHAGAKQDRQLLAQKLDTVRSRIHEKQVPYAHQFKLELEDLRNELTRWASATHFSIVANVTADEFRQFVFSNSFAEIPIIHLEVALLARLMTSHSNRKIGEGDVTDVDAMAAYLPYCDAYATDKLIASVGRSLDVEKTYECELFDASNDSVSKFINFLTDRLNTIPSANRPELTIFVVSDTDIKNNSFNFFKSLGNQAKDVARSGIWIDIVGFDDGKMPSYQMKDNSDLRIPFFGLQEVTVRKLVGHVKREKLIEICRKNCRSPHFLILDNHQELSNDFLLRAACAAGWGQEDFLSYQIYSQVATS
jgi:hypothetical protein